MAAGASVLLASASLAIVPLVASAAGSQTSGTTVTARPSPTVTGHPLTVVAQVVAVTGVVSTARAATGNVSTPTGTVDFTITGTHGVPAITCKNGNSVTVKHGRAKCKVIGGQLQAVGSPYTVTASYQGDDNFATSSGSTDVTVNRARTRTKVQMGPGRPRSGTPNAVTATVKTAHGGSLLSGAVTFSVSSVPVTSKTKCTNGGAHGSNTQPLVVVGNVGTAVCDLQPGWFVVSKVGPGNKYPHGAWNVTASYGGDSNFLPSSGHKGGHSRS
ncbi:MAG TPA: hypothetical protein VNC61_04975 [Acidimicrobiales bacterium]|nr:hypothetical protein [Acidimicrobiales bacterium]